MGWVVTTAGYAAHLSCFMATGALSVEAPVMQPWSHLIRNSLLSVDQTHWKLGFVACKLALLPFARSVAIDGSSWSPIRWLGCFHQVQAREEKRRDALVHHIVLCPLDRPPATAGHPQLAWCLPAIPLESPKHLPLAPKVYPLFSFFNLFSHFQLPCILGFPIACLAATKPMHFCTY